MITNETAKTTYTFISSVTEYAIGFLYKTNPDGSPQIKVYKNTLSTMPLTYGSNYTLSEDGAKVVISSGLESGDTLTIIRDIPMVQLSDYVIGRIDPEQIENDMDASVMRDQQILAQFDAAMEIPLDHESRIQACESDIEDIQALIPSQTSESNKLADRDFVNSSIATSTATFKGTYDTLAELEAVTADANDYGFVISTDAVGNTVYSRYKYTGSEWLFEYNLNNSSFTSDQWAAINSGATPEILATLEEAADQYDNVVLDVAANTSAITTLEGYDYVVAYQTPTPENSYTWYRKYKSGWVEQGGVKAAASLQTIQLPVEMADRYYTVLLTDKRNANSRDGNENSQVLYPNCTTTSLYVFINSNCNVYWEVKGMAATNN